MNRASELIFHDIDLSIIMLLFHLACDGKMNVFFSETKCVFVLPPMESNRQALCPLIGWKLHRSTFIRKKKSDNFLFSFFAQILEIFSHRDIGI